MTKGAALQQFFGQFMTAYATNAVPDDVTLPYLTYDAVFDAWGGGAVSLTVNMWFHTTSEAVPNAKALELSDAHWRRDAAGRWRLDLAKTRLPVLPGAGR